ncbi:MAG: AAA family ATPase [Atopobiaceae bacterium]|nr:AAA family ATPase [Atopobiaceae bacterium]
MDEIFEAEQQHLSEIYQQLLTMRQDLSEHIEVAQKAAAQDLIDMSEEIRVDFGGEDETLETLAAIETLNSVIDAYNQHHDLTVDKLGRVLLLLRQPYFAKLRLKMRPDQPSRDIYIGAAGITDERKRPLIVDWRSPIAETYYKQEMGRTSYQVDGRVREVDLELRRQFDITEDKLISYFDTTVAIQDSLLLNALKAHHSEKLQAITATIQREQNEVVRHEDVNVLLVNGIAGSGKTSVLLQRIAFLFYRERERLKPDQIYLFTPNSMFRSYIDTVLPSMGESNPQTFTWEDFLDELGLSERSSGRDVDPEVLNKLESDIPSLTIEPADLSDIRIDGTVLITQAQLQHSFNTFSRTPTGPRKMSLIREDLHEKLERRLASLARSEKIHEEIASIDLDEQKQIFGAPFIPEDEKEAAQFGRHYVELKFGHAHKLIEDCNWLRIDRIGMRMLGKESLTATEWLYCKVLLTGNRARDARYVMIDEVQDYTVSQLMLLSRYFSNAHFLLLGDENQAIREGTATFEQIRELFTKDHGSVEECELLTSYRSSPEISELFGSLIDKDRQMRLNSVRLAGVAPEIVECLDTEKYLEYLRSCAESAAQQKGLIAFVVADSSRKSWLAKQLGEAVKALHKNEPLPKEGVVLLELKLAKGLEFDEVIVADAQAEVYPDTALAKRQLYTAISRAMHKVTIVSQGSMTPLLEHARTEIAHER